MKKILLSTTLLVATAGVAAAEVTLSGSGRFGITYDESRGAGEEDVQLSYRMRVEFNGKVETDSGVTFGGRIRLQSTQSNFTVLTPDGSDTGTAPDRASGASLSAAYLSASYAGFQLQVGNANGALDSAALMYNSELGFTGFSAGDPSGFEEFSSGPYSSNGPASDTLENRVGIFVTYGIDDLNVYASYHSSNQNDDGRGTETYSVAADYKFDAFTISGGYQNVDEDAAGSTDYFAIAGEYAVNDAANIGLQYFNISAPGAGGDSDKITAYANYTFDAVTLRGFFSYQDDDDADTTEEVAYGIGVDYDLGGATLAAGIQNDFEDNIYAEAGVKFSF